MIKKVVVIKRKDKPGVQPPEEVGKWVAVLPVAPERFNDGDDGDDDGDDHDHDRGDDDEDKNNDLIDFQVAGSSVRFFFDFWILINQDIYSTT